MSDQDINTKQQNVQEYLRGVHNMLAQVFERSKEQIFEDGMESDFSKGIIAFVENHGDTAVDVLGDIIMSEPTDAETASEALRWIGQMKHPLTHSSRLRLLERGLFCLSERIRDGAVLGLSFLDDSRAIPSLRKAIEIEPCAELRDDMIQVIEQLKSHGEHNLCV
jgi:hypothetical protein